MNTLDDAMREAARLSDEEQVAIAEIVMRIVTCLDRLRIDPAHDMVALERKGFLTRLKEGLR